MNYKIHSTCQIPGLNQIYLNKFDYITNGTFVEIGAYDGEYVSNTSGLADIGWRGVYVEPVKSFYNKCSNRHQKNSNITTVNKAVSSTDGETLTIHSSGPLSSISIKSVENFKRMGWGSWGSEQQVTSITLETLLNECDIKPNFDLLVVDVEGYEHEVLKNWDINKWAPKMVIVELHDKNPNYISLNKNGELTSIREKFLKNGYRCVFENLGNSIFVREL
jgi:FkbM family methyltransferase